MLAVRFSEGRMCCQFPRAASSLGSCAGAERLAVVSAGMISLLSGAALLLQARPPLQRSGCSSWPSQGRLGEAAPVDSELPQNHDAEAFPELGLVRREPPIAIFRQLCRMQRQARPGRCPCSMPTRE
jgi:hypothetical protein